MTKQIKHAIEAHYGRGTTRVTKGHVTLTIPQSGLCQEKKHHGILDFLLAEAGIELDRCRISVNFT